MTSIRNVHPPEEAGLLAVFAAKLAKASRP
jgi:hypothetical protein